MQLMYWYIEYYIKIVGKSEDKMHNYYKAIGFGKGYSKLLIRNIINKAVQEYKEENKEDVFGKLIEIFVQFNKSMGLAIHGEFIDSERFEVEYAFPYVKAKNYSFYDSVMIEKNVSNYSFSAGCENNNTGVTIIFYMQNALDYVNKNFPQKVSAEVGFSGLSLSGKILFPVMEYDEYNKSYNKLRQNKSKMIVDAQNGDESAMENLTLDEMNEYTKISKRIQNEDVLSIVNTSFMPYGMQCDRYSVIGKIMDIEECINRITREKIYNITMECNDVIMNVAINEIDLIGKPMVGRRFKGNIWLQGNIRF